MILVVCCKIFRAKLVSARQKGFQFIAKIRSLNAIRNPRGQIPKINWNEIRWRDLIDLAEVNLRDPPTSEYFSDLEIFSFVTGNVTPTIQDLQSHSQRVERINWYLKHLE